LRKKLYDSLKIDPNFFIQHFKTKTIINFVKFVAAKKGMTTNFFSPLSFVAVLGSGIRDKHHGSATLLIITILQKKIMVNKEVFVNLLHL
jgi:hypothetical protein